MKRQPVVIQPSHFHRRRRHIEDDGSLDNNDSCVDLWAIVEGTAPPKTKRNENKQRNDTGFDSILPRRDQTLGLRSQTSSNPSNHPNSALSVPQNELREERGPNFPKVENNNRSTSPVPPSYRKARNNASPTSSAPQRYSAKGEDHTAPNSLAPQRPSKLENNTGPSNLNRTALQAKQQREWKQLKQRGREGRGRSLSPVRPPCGSRVRAMSSSRTRDGNQGAIAPSDDHKTSSLSQTNYAGNFLKAQELMYNARNRDTWNQFSRSEHGRENIENETSQGQRRRSLE